MMSFNALKRYDTKKKIAIYDFKLDPTKYPAKLRPYLYIKAFIIFEENVRFLDTTNIKAGSNEYTFLSFVKIGEGDIIWNSIDNRQYKIVNFSRKSINNHDIYQGVVNKIKSPIPIQNDPNIDSIEYKEFIND